MSSKTTVGTVQVILYAGLRGAEPIEVGTLSVPLTLRSASTGTLEMHLSEALEYVAEDVKRGFGDAPEATTDARA